MLKKGLSILLTLVMLLGVIAVLPLSASAEEADDVVAGAAEDKAPEEEAMDEPEELPEEDEPLEKEDSDLADVGAEADVADEGAQIDLADESSSEITLVVGATKTVYCNGSAPTFVTSGWSKSGDAVSIDYRGESCIVKGVRVGTATVSGWTQSKRTIVHPGYYYLGTWIDGWNEEQYETTRVSYTFRVVSSSSGSSSGSSSSSSSTTLSTPKINGGESLDGGAKLKWNSVSGAVKYRAFYKSGNGWTKIGDTTNNYIVFPNVYSGYTLTYTVRCINSAGTAYTSGFDSSGFRYTYNMAKPSIKSFSDTSSGVKITIGTVSNAKRYRVFVKNGSGWAKVGDTTGSTVTHTGAVKGRTYTYTVRCMKSDGSRFTSPYNATGWSHTRPLDTPSISKFTDTSTGTYVYIKAVSGAAKYRVFLKSSSGWTKLGDTTSTSFFDKTNQRGVARVYTVRCVNAAGNAYTSGFNANGWSHVRYLDTPSISKGESVANGMKLTIKAVTGAAKYRVFYKNGSGWTKLGDTTTTSFTDTSAAYGVARTYTVRCVTSAGNAYASNFNATGWTYTYYYAAADYPVLKTAYMDDEDDLFVTIEDNTDTAAFVSYYDVYVWKNQEWTYVGSVSKGYHWIIGPDLVNGKSYYFTVVGCDDDDYIVTDYNDDGFYFTM